MLGLHLPLNCKPVVQPLQSPGTQFAVCISRNLHVCSCRFLNHSCSPNVGSQMVLQRKGPAVVLFYALRDIQRGEALSISVRAKCSAPLPPTLQAHLLFSRWPCRPLPLFSRTSIHHWTGKYA